MSNISIVRSIIQDKPVHQSELVTFDGVFKTYRTKQFPIDDTSVVTTPAITAPASVKPETGLLTWTVAPTAADITIEYDSYILSDGTIQDLITLNTDVDDGVNFNLSGAACLDAMASNQVIIQKVIKTLDLQTDGASLAKALRAHAAVLRDLELNDKYQEASFDFAQQVNDNPGFREKILKDLMREEG